LTPQVRSAAAGVAKPIIDAIIADQVILENIMPVPIAFLFAMEFRSIRTWTMPRVFLPVDVQYGSRKV
jgi:hypothetical protein